MNKKICVVGAGRWGRNHVKTLKGLECLAGVVETNPQARAELAKEYPGAKFHADLQDALSEGYDGFTVATPAEAHHTVARAILKAGKPVLVEKPIALSARDARELKELAESRGVLLMVGHVMLFHPAIRKIKEIVDSGKLGRIQYLYSNRLNLGTVRTEENILWSFAPHDISIFQHLVGKVPVEVVSRGGAFVQPHIHDSTNTIITYPDNVVGHIFVSWLHPFKEHRLVVIGSKGMISFDDATEEKALFYYEKGVDWVNGAPIKRDGPTEKISFGNASPLTEELRHFVSSIDGGATSLASGASGVEVLEILERASASLLQRAPAVPQVKQAPPFYVHPSSFVDDNVEIGEGTKIWHFSHVQPGARVGKNCSIGQNVNIANNVRIGNNVKIQNNVSVYEGVELEDFVFCGPSMVFTNVMAPRSKYPQRGSQHYSKTLLREGASIGANATIVCNHTIGRHAFVAAGAVVASDVPDFALMMGVPAKRTGWVCECGKRLAVSSKTPVACGCGIRYSLEAPELLVQVEKNC